MKFLVKINHWQLFILSWGPLSFSLILLFGHPGWFLGLFPLSLSSFLIGSFFSFNWHNSITSELYDKFGANFKLNYWKYKLSYWIPTSFFIYMISFLLFNVFIHKVKSYNAELELKIIIGLIIISILCIINGICFTAKLIKSIEIGRIATIKEWIPEFILLLFAPIGLWNIQPRINKILNEELQNKMPAANARL